MNKHLPPLPPLGGILEGVCENMPSHRERDDHYSRIVAQPGPRWRIILCRDGLQWIIQKKEASHAGPWRAEGYYTYRESLIKACGTLGLLSDAGTEAALHGLPERLTGTPT